MKIQQYKKFQLKNNEYGFLGTTYYQNPISYVELFLYRSSGHIYRKGGPVAFLNSLVIRGNGECGMTFDMVDLNVDYQNNLIYLGEIFDAYEANMTDEEFNIKYNNMNALQLCQNKITDCAVMTKDNFIHLLTKWGELWQSMPSFILLYLDDKNWYDVLPFDSQEIMDKFISDHIK